MGPGSIVADRFVVTRLLARGGMADIHEATDRASGGRVVLKVLREDLSREEEALARFRREARTAMAIDNDHVARVFDFGTTEADRPFIVMELLEGHDLAKELDLRGVLPLEEAVGLIAEACEGVAAAHAAGIIHRDLKPSNLFLATRQGRRSLQVLDFGISKLVQRTDQHVTLTKALFGSPLYMSPEQFRSAKAADERSDVWSMGVILYEMLTGLPPFVAENAPAVGLAVTREAHVPPSVRRPKLPKAIDQIVDGALKKDPRERYQSMVELLRALEDLRPGAKEDTPTGIQLVPSIAPPPDDPPTHVVTGEDDPPTHVVTGDDDPPTHLDLTKELSPLRTPQGMSLPVLDAASRSSRPPGVAEGDGSERPSAPVRFGLDPAYASSDPRSTHPSAPPMPAPQGRARSVVAWSAVSAVAAAVTVWLVTRAPAEGAAPSVTGSARAEGPDVAGTPSVLVPAEPSTSTPREEPEPAPSAAEATAVDDLPPAPSASARKRAPRGTGKKQPGLFMPRGI